MRKKSNSYMIKAINKLATALKDAHELKTQKGFKDGDRFFVIQDGKDLGWGYVENFRIQFPVGMCGIDTPNTLYLKNGTRHPRTHRKVRDPQTPSSVKFITEKE